MIIGTRAHVIHIVGSLTRSTHIIARTTVAASAAGTRAGKGGEGKQRVARSVSSLLRRYRSCPPNHARQCTKYITLCRGFQAEFLPCVFLCYIFYRSRPGERRPNLTPTLTQPTAPIRPRLPRAFWKIWENWEENLWTKNRNLFGSLSGMFCGTRTQPYQKRLLGNPATIVLGSRSYHHQSSHSSTNHPPEILRSELSAFVCPSKEKKWIYDIL